LINEPSLARTPFQGEIDSSNGRRTSVGRSSPPSLISSAATETRHRFDTVNGFDCEIYEVWRSGVRERELCVTDWGNVAGGDDVVDAFHAMGEFMTEMLDSLPKMGNGASIGDAAYEHMKEMDGFPVRTREYGDDGVFDGESQLVEAKEVATDSSDFSPPKKYKQKDLMKGMK